MQNDNIELTIFIPNQNHDLMRENITDTLFIDSNIGIHSVQIDYETSLITSINDNELTMNPNLLSISNYPNPFNPNTTIAFEISESSHIVIEIFNIKGQKINTLINENKTTGKHSVVWNGENQNSEKTSSGIYFYSILIDNKLEQINKCIMIK